MATLAQGFEIYVDGSDLACFFKTFGTRHGAGEVDTTFLCNDGDMSFLPGPKDAGLSVEGAFDYDATDADGVNDILKTAYDAQSNLVTTAANATMAAGGIAIMCNGPITNYSVETPLNQLVMANFEVRNSGGIYYGSWIDTKMDADTETKNSASLDNGAETTNGGLFQAHLILESDSDASSGGTSIILQHSTDDAAWADLVATQAFSGTFDGLHSVVSSIKTVHRYLRFQVTTDGVAHVVACFKRL